MGKMYMAKCENCDYTFETLIGIGFSFDDRNKYLLKKIQRGEYGGEIKKKAENIPNCVVRTSYELFVCQKCGCIERKDLIKLYDEKDISKCQYTHDKHPCVKCKGKMQYIAIDDEFTCPKCKNKIKFRVCGWWD